MKKKSFLQKITKINFDLFCFSVIFNVILWTNGIPLKSFFSFFISKRHQVDIVVKIPFAIYLFFVIDIKDMRYITQMANSLLITS